MTWPLAGEKRGSSRVDIKQAQTLNELTNSPSIWPKVKFKIQSSYTDLISQLLV